MDLLIYIAQRFTIASNLRENQASCVIQCRESERNMIRGFALQTRGNSNPVLDTFSASDARVTRRMESSRAMQLTTYDLCSKVRPCMCRSNPQPHQDPNVPPYLYFTSLALRVPLLARHLSRTSSVILKGGNIKSRSQPHRRRSIPSWTRSPSTSFTALVDSHSNMTEPMGGFQTSFPTYHLPISTLTTNPSELNRL